MCIWYIITFTMAVFTSIFSVKYRSLFPGTKQLHQNRDIESEQRRIGNILYHDLGFHDKENILIALQLRLVQSDLYGGMDEGHEHYWWNLWRLYKSTHGTVSDKIRRGCQRALTKGNLSTFRWTHIHTSSSSSSDDDSWDSITSPTRSVKSMSSLSSTSGHLSMSRYTTLLRLWLSMTTTLLSQDEVCNVMHPFTYVDMILHQANAYDDCLYPRPKTSEFGLIRARESPHHL